MGQSMWEKYCNELHISLKNVSRVFKYILHDFIQRLFSIQNTTSPPIK